MTAAVDIVTVDENNINDIRMVNLDEAVTTMFPLLEPAFDDLANQIVRNQSVSDIAYSDDNKYTSLVLLDAIKTSLGRQKPGCTKLNLRLRLAFTKCSTKHKTTVPLTVVFSIPCAIWHHVSLQLLYGKLYRLYYK